MLQNIDDSLNSLAFVGGQKFARSRMATRGTRYRRLDVGTIQQAEQSIAALIDTPMTETLFEPLRSVERWTSGESMKQIADETAIPVQTIHRMLKNLKNDVVKLIDKSSPEERYPLRGKPIQYLDPFGPVAEEDWEVLR